MTEHELYEIIVSLRKTTEALIESAMELPPTIELCVFTGKVGSLVDILSTLEAAGVPIADPDEKARPLEN